MKPATGSHSFGSPEFTADIEGNYACISWQRGEGDYGEHTEEVEGFTLGQVLIHRNSDGHITCIEIIGAQHLIPGWGDEKARLQLHAEAS